MEPMEQLEAKLQALLAAVEPGDRERVRSALVHWDAVAKPLHGLGELERAVARMAGVAPLRREYKKCVAAFCADNGVVAEGVTQTDSSVTAVVAGNMRAGQASVCCMGRVTGADVVPVDAGMLTEVEGLRSIKAARGTENLARTPAMARASPTRACKRRSPSSTGPSPSTARTLTTPWTSSARWAGTTSPP